MAPLAGFCKAEVQLFRYGSGRCPWQHMCYVAGCSLLKGKMPLDEAGMSAGKTRDRSGQFSRGMAGHQERQEQAAAEICYHRTDHGYSRRERGDEKPDT